LVPDRPYGYQDRVLQASFGTKDPAKVLSATETIAWALSHEGLGRQVLEKLAQEDQPMVSVAARELLKQRQLKRFRCLGL
jgi:hypothetical protein